MKFILALLGFLALAPVKAQTATATYTQAETCLDTPGPAPGTTFSATSCVKVGCGPALTTSLTRTSAAGSALQTWQPWNSIASTGMVVGCVNGAVTNTWVTQSQITATPAAPASTTVTLPVTWNAPTTNIDGSAIITGSLTYNLYTGPSATALSKSQSALSATQSSLPNATVGSTICVAVTAVEATVESVQTPAVCVTAQVPNPTPGPPTNLMVSQTE